MCVCEVVLAPSVCCHRNMAFRHLTCWRRRSCDVAAQSAVTAVQDPPAAEPVFTTAASFCHMFCVEEDDSAVIF